MPSHFFWHPFEELLEECITFAYSRIPRNSIGSVWLVVGILMESTVIEAHSLIVIGYLQSEPITVLHQLQACYRMQQDGKWFYNSNITNSVGSLSPVS